MKEFTNVRLYLHSSSKVCFDCQNDDYYPIILSYNHTNFVVRNWFDDLYLKYRFDFRKRSKHE